MVILFIFGAGLILALIFMIFASFSSYKSSAQFFCVLAFGALILQGGCWSMALKVGSSTGAHSNGTPEFLLVGSFLVASVWTYALLSKRPPDPDDKDNNNVT